MNYMMESMWKGGTSPKSVPHRCPYSHDGMDPKRCLEIGGKNYRRNKEGCCGTFRDSVQFASCNFFQRRCVKCLEMGRQGLKANAVSNIEEGTCYEHDVDKKSRRPEKRLSADPRSQPSVAITSSVRPRPPPMVASEEPDTLEAPEPLKGPAGEADLGPPEEPVTVVTLKPGTMALLLQGPVEQPDVASTEAAPASPEAEKAEWQSAIAAYRAWAHKGGPRPSERTLSEAVNDMLKSKTRNEVANFFGVSGSWVDQRKFLGRLSPAVWDLYCPTDPDAFHLTNAEAIAVSQVPSYLEQLKLARALLQPRSSLHAKEVPELESGKVPGQQKDGIGNLGERRSRVGVLVDDALAQAASTKVASLDSRPFGVLALMAEGLSNPEIAARLDVALRTVENAVTVIHARLRTKYITNRKVKRSTAVQAYQYFVAASSAKGPAIAATHGAGSSDAVPADVPKPDGDTAGDIRGLRECVTDLGEALERLRLVLTQMEKESGTYLSSGSPELEAIRADLEMMCERLFQMHALFVQK